MLASRSLKLLKVRVRSPRQCSPYRMCTTTLVLTALWSTSAFAEQAAFDHSHSQWDGILAKHVRWVPGGHDSAVDYAALKREPELNVYLESLSGVPETEFRAWTPRQQLSFLLNAYNAYTVALVASRYPIESIKDIGGWSSPWSYEFVPLFGNKVSLDHIEHDLIRAGGHRGGYADPRIHFAVNCASIGCPALRPEAYRFDRLDRQLEDAERRFLGDRSRNRFDPDTGVLTVSPIFDWYTEDFEQGEQTLEGYFRTRAHLFATDPEAERKLRENTISVQFGEYDWRLNDGQP